MTSARTSRLRAALTTLALTTGLAACAGTGMGSSGPIDNRSLYSVKQPVVERTSMTLEVASGYGGLNAAERQRIDDWFDAMNLRFGDQVMINDPATSPATREAVAQLAGRRGLLVSNNVPVADGSVAPGRARIIVTRATASVPGCPDWSHKSDFSLANAASPNFGCGVNSNLAAMVANPQDLVEGQQGTGETVILTSTKAIDTYREQPPTGTRGLNASPTTGGN